MSVVISSVRGVHGYFPQEYASHHYVSSLAERISGLFGFSPMLIPTLEHRSLFERSAGGDIQKELYEIVDLTPPIILRPEGTACAARMAAECQMFGIHKFFYYGQMFRHDRPQKGRYREFQQFGLEYFGERSAFSDVEILSFVWRFLKELGLDEKVAIKINSLGSQEAQERYKVLLHGYFIQHEESLSDDSKRRLITNPLRILDSKDEGDRKLICDAPIIDDAYDDDDANHFDELCSGLDSLGINYERSRDLVRGLDYYNGLVFEVVSQHLGAQGTIIAGGRYDDLCKLVGHRDGLSGLGCAGGIERISLLLNEIALPRTIAVIAYDIDWKNLLPIVSNLRDNDISVDMFCETKLRKSMQRAERRNCSWSIIIGEDELANGCVTLRNMDTGEQNTIRNDQILEILAKYGNR